MSLKLCSSSRITHGRLTSRVSRDTLDRYGAIRTFFIGQRTNVAVLRTPESTNASTQLSLQDTIFQRSRHFHFSNVTGKSHRGSKKGREENDTRVGIGTAPKPKQSEIQVEAEDNSKANNEETLQKATEDSRSEQTESPPPPAQSEPEPGPEPKPYILPYNFAYYSGFFRRLALSVPHFHAPTRDDFLRVTDGFWQRLRIRFKWFTIRSFRRYNADDISGMLTWFIMSQTVWILVGTTTFFSVAFAIVNSLQMQHSVARAISDYLTDETGVTVIFESAIVPKWKDSRISFKNVYISRRPQSVMTAQRRKFKEHQTALGYDITHHPAFHTVGDDDEEDLLPAPEEDTNYTMFDLNIGSIDVKLSLWRLLDGKGLIESAVIKGVRGVIDRRSIHYDPDHPWDPASFRHPSNPGDFELESLQLEDLLVTIHQPGDFRPYTASIFRADIGLFRKRWLFYDFLSADNIVGQFDNCLFSLHTPQSIGRTTEMDLQDGEWERMARFRIDGVNIDHVQAASGSTEGPIAWITSGKLDAVFDFKFPRDPDEAAFGAILEDIAESISTTVLSNPAESKPELKRIPGQRELAKPALAAPETEDDSVQDDGGAKVVIDIDFRLRDVKAAVPIFTNDLSYVNNALIRPIVAFMNANRTLVPIRCRVVKPLSDFDGSWTMWETGLMDEISLKVYDALAYHVSQANFNKRIKTVSVWSLQMTANAVMSALRTLVDPVSLRLREAYLRSREGEEDGGVLYFDPNTQPAI